MSDKLSDAAPTEPQAAENGRAPSRAKLIAVAAATPFKRMPYVPKRRRLGRDRRAAAAAVRDRGDPRVPIATAIAAAYVMERARQRRGQQSAAQGRDRSAMLERQQQIEAEQRAAAERQRLRPKRSARASSAQARSSACRGIIGAPRQRCRAHGVPRRATAAAGLRRGRYVECANHYIRAKRSFEAQYAREQRQRAASAPQDPSHLGMGGMPAPRRIRRIGPRCLSTTEQSYGTLEPRQ